MLSRWLCCAMPITTCPTSFLSSFVFSIVARMAMPPSCVVEKRAKRPASLLFTRMSARGVRRAPSRMTIEEELMMLFSLVKERRGDARPVLNEVLHSDVHVDGRAATREALGLDLQTFGEGQSQTAAHDVDEDGVDRERAMPNVDARQCFDVRHRRGRDGGELHFARSSATNERLRLRERRVDGRAVGPSPLARVLGGDRPPRPEHRGRALETDDAR